MTLYDLVFFIVHCLLHFFGYWIPCAVGACVDLLLCRPCRTCEKKKHGYSYHPAREVRLIHSIECTETVVDVFGLMDARGPSREDRQYHTLAVPHNEAQHAQELEKAPASAGKGRGSRCEKSSSAKACACLSGSTTVRAEQGRVASHSPLEPAPLEPEPPEPSAAARDLDKDDTYNSQRYPHLPSSSPACSPHPLAHSAAATTTKHEAAAAPPASQGNKKKVFGRPTYTSLDGATRKEIKRCHLTYDAPLYGPHIGTIMGVFRPYRPVTYVREEMRAWDGCYIAMDWCYVDGEAPTSYDHEHTSRQRRAEAAAAAGSSDSFVDIAANEPFSKGCGESAAPPPAAGHEADHTLHNTGGQATRRAAEGSQGDGKRAQRRRAAAEQCTTASVPIAPPNAPPTQLTSDGSLKSHSREGGASAPESTPGKAVGVVFLVPGLTSHAQSNYVQHIVRVLHRADLHVCVLTTRGMGDTPPVTTPFLFNGAYTRDVRDCLQLYLTKEGLAARFGRVLPLIGLGLSIGGIILSKYVGEEGIAGADPHLDAFICCCSPIDYVMTVEHMNRNGAQRTVYQHDMCNDIRSYLLRYEPLQHLPNVDNEWLFEQGNVHRFRRVVHFDEHVVAKSAGYRSAHHYHVDASAVTWLPYVPIPTLVVSTADDPVIGPTVMPHRWREMTHNNPRLVYVEPPAGGHLGFLGDPWSELMDRDNWAEVFVRERVLAACAYWCSVQRRARESDAVTCSGGNSAAAVRGGSRSNPPPTSSMALFSPTTATVTVTAAAAAAVQPSTVVSGVARCPSYSLMKVVVIEQCGESRANYNVGDSESHAAHAVGDQRGGDEDDRAFLHYATQYEESPLDLGAVREAETTRAPGHGSTAVAAPSTSPLCFLPYQAPESKLAGASSHSSPNARYTNDRTAAFQKRLPASPRPIQYLPPREDRPTNRCYFTYYCTPAVPQDRLDQPYFSTDPRPHPDDNEEDANDDNLSTSTMTTFADDGRSSMYATGSGGGDRRRRSMCREHEFEGAGVPGTGKDPRCMMVAGQYTYTPVMVNCDYVGDPRTMMLDD